MANDVAIYIFSAVYGRQNTPATYLFRIWNV